MFYISGFFSIIGKNETVDVQREETYMEKLFHLKENNTNVSTEIMAGITTFMTMAYILAVNPNIMSAAGMDRGAVFTATALSAAIGTLLMAGLANYPFVLAPGMGLNAYFAYTVVGAMGYPWQVALAAVFCEGIIFIILSLTSVREAIFNAIPMTLKHAVSAGIGLFIAFIGLQNAKIVVANESTLLGMYSFKSALANGEMKSIGITVLLALIGTLITGIFVIRGVKGNILWGILITWLLGIVCQLTGLYVPNAELGMYSLLPDFSNGIQVPGISATFGQVFQVNPKDLMSVNFVIVLFAFLFVDLFDTLGTLIGVSSKADMLDENGKLPKIKGALLADAVATTAGAVLGTSTVTTFVESASGVSEGGRTGLTSVTAAILFGLSVFLSPIFLAIPSFATAPALIVVGFLMMGSVMKIDFNDSAEAVPAFLCIMAMPFLYSISEGISFGVISYVILNTAAGKAREKKISLLMYVLAVIFVLKYILI